MSRDEEVILAMTSFGASENGDEGFACDILAAFQCSFNQTENFKPKLSS